MSDRLPWLQSATVLVGTLVIGALLVHLRLHFSVESYPWCFPDSFDWLVNGLRYSGLESATFEVSHRAMLLPLTFAALMKAGAERYITLFGTVFHCMTVVGLYFLAARTESVRVAFWAAAFTALSFTLLGQSAFIGSDVAANFFLMVSALALSNFSRDGKIGWVAIGLLSAAIGIHAQYIGLIVAPSLLISLFLYDQGGRPKWGLTRLKQLLVSPQTYFFVGLAFVTGLALLAPRLLTFKVLYAEHVQHGSLVKLHLQDPLFYLCGLVSSFSWPMVALMMLGAIAGLIAQSSRRATVFHLLWIANVLLFFSVLYTWKDLRLLLYLSVPFLILSARGLVTLLDLISNALKHSPVLSWCAKATTCVMALFYVSSPSTSDPFDATFAITPWTSASFDREHLISSRKEVPHSYFLLHTSEARTELANRQQPSFDGLGYSAPLQSLMNELRSSHADLWTRSTIYFVSPQIPPHEAYIVRNRNTLYAKKSVLLVGSLEELPALLTSQDTIVIVRTTDWDLASQRLTGTERLHRLSSSEGPYVAFAGSTTQPITARPAHRLPTFVAGIQAPENPSALMDGVIHHAQNWAAAPLGRPIEISLSRTPVLKTAIVYLWDFDGRSYRFTVRGLSDNSWHSLGEWQGVGTIEVPLNDRPFDALQFVGIENSNVSENPANTIFHVLEIELVASNVNEH